MEEDSCIPIAIVGASGYTGAELIEILCKHPRVKIVGLFGSDKQSENPPLSKLHPQFRQRVEMPVQASNLEVIVASGAKAVFLATPHELSHELAPKLIERGLRVIDLSGAYRSPEVNFYAENYGFIHRHPEWARKAVYGLPEFFGGSLASAQLVANPGCYPTSVLLPLKPLLEANLLDRSFGLTADCISGISGAGRHAKPELHFSEVSARAYGIFSHRHSPEIETWLGAPIIFVPHVAPFDRGMLSTLHALAKEGITEAQLRDCLQKRYAKAPFVRLYPSGEWPAVRNVVGSNYCDIALAMNPKDRRIVLVSAIDNLVKGASGQAVQNFNLCFGFPETEGLLT